MFRRDNGDRFTAQQVIDLAINEYGVPDLLTAIAARLGWESRYMPVADALTASKDTEALLMIAERVERMQSEVL